MATIELAYRKNVLLPGLKKVADYLSSLQSMLVGLESSGPLPSDLACQLFSIRMAEWREIYGILRESGLGPSAERIEQAVESCRSKVFDLVLSEARKDMTESERAASIEAFGPCLPDAIRDDIVLSALAEVGDAIDTVEKMIAVAEAEAETTRLAPLTVEPKGRADKQMQKLPGGVNHKKLLHALREHHKFDGDSVLKLEPIGSNELASLARVGRATASRFFQYEFEGHAKYKVYCQSGSAKIVDALKAASGQLPLSRYEKNFRQELLEQFADNRS